MARRYTATNTLRVWKAHRCVGCGAAYRYRFIRKLSGQGATEAAASAALQKIWDHTLGRVVDPRPCPHCGVLQPDMMAQERRARSGWLLATILFATVALLLVVLTDGLRISAAATLLTVVSVTVAALLAWFALRDPNRDLAANRQTAQDLLHQDQVRLDASGGLDLPREGPAWRRLSPLAGFALALGALLPAAPEAVRELRGWADNAGFYPGVVGPGDSPTFYLPDHIGSVKGYWRGEPEVVVLNAKALGLAPAPGLPPPAEPQRQTLQTDVPTRFGPRTTPGRPPGQTRLTLPPSLAPAAASEDVTATRWSAVTRQDSWGSKMSVKSSEKNSDHTLWATVNVPDDPTLAGRTAQLGVRLAVSYPQMMGSNAFETVHTEHTAQPTLTLATAPRAGVLYRNLWLFGAAGGGLLLALTAGLMRRAAGQDAPNTQLGFLPLNDAPPGGALPTQIKA